MPGLHRDIDAPSAPRPFTNRHDLIAAFRDAYASSTLDRHTVLNLHGKGGIGKTKLMEHLRAKHTQPDDAVGYLDLGLDAEARAEPLYVRALEGFERRLRPDHPNTRIVRDNLRAFRASRGQSE